MVVLRYKMWFTGCMLTLWMGASLYMPWSDNSKQSIQYYSPLKHNASNQSIKHNTPPKHSIALIKIQKTGSGALHNVLGRLAFNHNLTVAFERKRIFPSVAKQKYLLNKPPYQDYHRYNLFIDHARFHRESHLQYMAADTVFITQLRHPFAHAQSAYYLFKWGKKYHKSFEQFLRRAGKLSIDNDSYSPVQNFQAFMLGFKEARQNNLTEFKSFLWQVDKQLYFVGLLEFSDETSVLLRRKMKWHIRDVLHIHTHRSRPNVKKLSPQLEWAQNESLRLHREHSKLDYVLYDFFKDRLFKEIKQQPLNFYSELEQYRALNVRFSHFCDDMCKDFHGVNASNITKIQRMLHTSIDVPGSEFNSAFRLTYLDCLMLGGQEKVLQRVLKVKQYPDACNNVTGKSYVGYNLKQADCSFKNQLYPGYYIKDFQAHVLNTEACLGNFYD